MPIEAELEFTRPPAFSAIDDSTLAKLLDDAVQTRLRAARELLRQQGSAFVGAKDVLRQAFSAVPQRPHHAEIRTRALPLTARPNGSARSGGC